MVIITIGTGQVHLGPKWHHHPAYYPPPFDQMVRYHPHQYNPRPLYPINKPVPAIYHKPSKPCYCYKPDNPKTTLAYHGHQTAPILYPGYHKPIEVVNQPSTDIVVIEDLLKNSEEFSTMQPLNSSREDN